MPRDLRKFAQGKPCMVRLVGTCNFDQATTVLAHIRRGNVAGMGQKPPDTCAVWACSACHDAIDSRTAGGLSRTEIDSEVLAALCRQLAWYDKHEVLMVCV